MITHCVKLFINDFQFYLPTSQDDTLKLVLATMESIIGEYNNTVKTLVESYDNVDSVTEDDPLF